jgi:hypothetical protein
MPVHDWTRVDAGIFHHFRIGWICDLSRALNRSLLPPDYYALAEQVEGAVGPDVPTLQHPESRTDLADEPGAYAAKARSVVIRHASRHKIIAICEIVSPGNKSSRHGLRAFVDKAVNILRAGIHLVILDLFPAGPRNPQGIHKAIWNKFNDNDFTLPPRKPLTLASYIGGAIPEAFVEPTAVGAVLPEMPLFLTADVYVPLPLELTYQSAWEAVPSYWQKVLTAPVPS